MFPNIAPGQERYYLTNVLKKPQPISLHQFVQRVEQLSSYIAQPPSWYHSPSAKPIKIPANDPFTEADLESHVLWLCPLMWQDHFNLHKKGMTPMDMHLFLMSYDSRDYRVRMYRKSPMNNPARKLPTRVRKESINLVLRLRPESLRKHAPRNISTSTRNMGACILRTLQETVISMRNTGKRKPISVPGGKKTQSHKEFFHADEGEVGKAREAE
jgi:hypothetical protein